MYQRLTGLRVDEILELVMNKNSHRHTLYRLGLQGIEHNGGLDWTRLNHEEIEEIINRHIYEIKS